MQPTIFLVEPDDTVRPVLLDNLRRWGYTVIVVLDVPDAIQRVQGKREPFNLLLLNQFEQSIEQSIALGHNISKEAGLLNLIPMVIMAERYGDDMEGQNIQVGEWEYVTYLEDGQQLKDLLYQLCPVL